MGPQSVEMGYEVGIMQVLQHGQRIDVENQIIYPGFAYEVMASNGVVERFADNLALKYYYYEQLTTLLQDAGFRIREEYGWYDKSPIENGRELIFACTR
ncbi:hypothetical protein [Desulfitobacterium hafniense]|uniref:hypothetical protein n=1 Tax=Desulfitobacterium hafniense TaxID=49338 RepID=UPI00035F3F58|nr:hypothetical protein [Desulfitobacterium hafniense]